MIQLCRVPLSLVSPERGWQVGKHHAVHGLLEAVKKFGDCMVFILVLSQYIVCEDMDATKRTVSERTDRYRMETDPATPAMPRQAWQTTPLRAARDGR